MGVDGKVIGSEDLNWLNRVRDRDQWRATNFWVLRNIGDFVTGCVAVGLLLGVTTGKGNYCKAVTAVRCFLCNAGPAIRKSCRILVHCDSSWQCAVFRRVRKIAYTDW
jgi:hypothetical protein